MTHADDWEPVRYRDLPDWVKEDSKPQRWVRNTYKTVFYGDPYDYLVQYTVDKGTLTLSYWKNSPHIPTGKKTGKKNSPTFFSDTVWRDNLRGCC